MWYYDRGYDHKRFNQELAKVKARRPTEGNALLRRLRSRKAEQIDLRTMADLCEEEGFPVLAKVVRNSMFIRHRGKKTKVYATRTTRK